jgi:hypothetical protein
MAGKIPSEFTINKIINHAFWEFLADFHKATDLRIISKTKKLIRKGKKIVNGLKIVRANILPL